MNVNGWDVVIEMLDRLWGIENITVQNTVKWAEEKLKKCGENDEKKLGDEFVKSRKRPTTKTTEPKLTIEEKKEKVRDTMGLGMKAKVKKTNSDGVRDESPGLQAAILRVAIASESSLSPPDVRHAILSSWEMYGDMRGLSTSSGPPPSGRLP